MVKNFLTPTQCAPFRAQLSVPDLLSELKACFIDINLVCVYMVVGNYVQHEGIFADLGNFDCTDAFLGYSFWLLMKEVFLIAAEDNLECFANYELPAPAHSQLTGTSTVCEKYQCYLTKRVAECERRREELVGSVVVSKRDLHQYFFAPCAPQAHDETPLPDADSPLEHEIFAA